MNMDSTEFDRRVGVVEDALYELKNSGYAQAPDVTAIDNMLACTAELKVELYGMLLGWNNVDRQAKHVTIFNGFHTIDLFVCGLLSALFGVGLQALFGFIPTH